jgi:hypothetical protein
MQDEQIKCNLSASVGNVKGRRVSLPVLPAGGRQRGYTELVFFSDATTVFLNIRLKSGYFRWLIHSRGIMRLLDDPASPADPRGYERGGYRIRARRHRHCPISLLMADQLIR